ncbi:hypothetical protein CHH28_11395 [Bacterioplanes sanyensis]|uniref:Uncharacterized protein n=1 Tax=Bacterioplanes sanyensis TaxID=1249553 RepID=A0A222FLZ3_9GAMM|nr:hypothetical protein [Bacterioplanes sanyensis]ASP39243.1 hypothetical protein CHH28_11395 [Bacterioplanes sanyensis]
MLTLSKVLVTMATVLLLASVAERLSPKHAGLLAGFPLGTAIALYFFAAQHGTDFAAASAIYTLAGLTAAMALAWGYWQIIRRRPGLSWLPLAIGAGLVCFAVTSALLQSLPAQRWLALTVTLAAIVLFRYQFRVIAEHPKTGPGRGGWFAKHSVTLLFRAGLAALTIVLITALADWLGPARAGLLAAFPISFFPLMLILHSSYGAGVLASSIRHYPTGMGALLTYCLTVSYSYPHLGHDIGTLVALVMACVYLLLNHYFSQALSRR